MSNIKDANGQPLNSNLNRSRNKEKAIYTLRGLLVGVASDSVLKESEIFFLHEWLKKAEALAQHGDRIDLLHLIGKVVQRGAFEKSEIDEINESIQDVIGYGAQTAKEIENKTNELLGILQGMISDSVLNDAEILHLKKWLEGNQEIATDWPGDILYQRLQEILKDGKITALERESLLQSLREISGSDSERSGFSAGLSGEFFGDNITQFNHDGKTICFTGKFLSGSRAKVEGLAQEQGANIATDVSERIDALIVGAIASKDWRFSSYGRKIEKALSLKKVKPTLQILSEKTWLELL